jgi:hypothetical protein
MNPARLNHIGVASSIVIASEAKQSSAVVGLGTGLPRCARNDGGVSG